MLVGIPKTLAMLTFHIVHQQFPLSTDVGIGEWLIWLFLSFIFIAYILHGTVFTIKSLF